MAWLTIAKEHKNEFTNEKDGGVGQNMIPKYFESEEKILNLGEDGAEKTLTLNMARNLPGIVPSSHRHIRKIR